MQDGGGRSASFEERTRIPGTPPIRFNNIMLFSEWCKFEKRDGVGKEYIAVVWMGTRWRLSASFEKRRPGTADPF